MSITDILDTLLLGPLKLIFEIIFSLALQFVDHPGIAIVALSLAMNILVLPLYRQADAMQEKARDTENRLRDGIQHIKKHFSGDERMMILQTYYRQNHYSPLSALNGSISLLLEVPFFMAAYQFLSNLESLKGVSLGPIADLSSPDSLIVMGSLTINFLPILMTLVNVVSSALYLKGFPLKTKIQLYAMAAFFLVFLYDSPAGLLLYWTLNNVFSLVKTIFYKLKNPRKVLSYLTFTVGILLLAFLLTAYRGAPLMRKLLVAVISVSLQLPALLPLIQKKLSLPECSAKPNGKIFFLGGLLLTILVGILIPSAFIAASPQEYVDITYFYHPTWYIVSTCCLAAGTFLIWLGVFYWLASPKFKVLFERLIWIFCISALVGYMFFGTDLGIISASLQYDNGMDFTWKEQLINLAVLGLLAGILLFAAFKWQHIIIPVMLSVCIALGGMAAWNIGNIQKSIAVLASFQDTDEFPHIELSKHDKNVVVIMLDRAMSEYVPYILKEKPNLKSQFAGFTYYDNTISFGSHTNFGTPPLYGGYEYTPVEMNKRDKELLADKHNEALRVMPVIFWENGYDVTVCEQPYANYQYVTDFSIYDDYPEINTFYTFGKFADPRVKQAVISQTRRNFFCFSVMKTLPLFLQETVYDEGRYLQAATAEIPRSIGQTIHSLSTATGTNATFMEQYHMLDHLPAITSASEEKGDTFYLMSNEITHSRMLLQTPNYIPSDNVDNTAYDASHTSRFTVDGKTLKMETEKQMSSYHANMAAFLNLGRWMDHLRDLGIYDNTKIILVADHGFALGQIEQWPTTVSPESPTETRGVEAYYPLLMVKDFNSQKFEISHEFMTNADVPTLAMKDTVSNPVNPFTGNPINDEEKTAHDQFIILSDQLDILSNNGNTYFPSEWASVSDDIWDNSNWHFYPDTFVLKEHAAP